MTDHDSVMATVPEAIEEYRRGKFVIITDDEDRENEGDLVMAAQFVTPDAINFMAKYGRGLICIPLTEQRVADLRLPMMSEQNTSGFGTPFTVSVEARTGVTTGISAGDRARTVQVLIDPTCSADDIAKPGHMFPLRARDGGVLVRAGQTEASIDLCKMSGLYPGAVLCEIMKADGEMAIVAYRAEGYPDEHVAIVRGTIDSEQPVLVRVHDQCVTGDVFDSLRC